MTTAGAVEPLQEHCIYHATLFVAEDLLIHDSCCQKRSLFFKKDGGAARDVVGIRRGAISGNMKVSFQAARSIG